MSILNNYDSVLKRILFLIIISFLAISCGGNEAGNPGSKPSPEIEFLGRSTCAHSPHMEKSLDAALKKRGIGKKYTYIDMGSLPADDPRRGYGSPTVLINGEDLFGMPRPKKAPASLT